MGGNLTLPTGLGSKLGSGLISEQLDLSMAPIRLTPRTPYAVRAALVGLGFVLLSHRGSAATDVPALFWKKTVVAADTSGCVRMASNELRRLNLSDVNVGDSGDSAFGHDSRSQIVVACLTEEGGTFAVVMAASQVPGDALQMVNRVSEALERATPRREQTRNQEVSAQGQREPDRPSWQGRRRRITLPEETAATKTSTPTATAAKGDLAAIKAEKVDPEDPKRKNYVLAQIRNVGKESSSPGRTLTFTQTCAWQGTPNSKGGSYIDTIGKVLLPQLSPGQEWTHKFERPPACQFPSSPKKTYTWKLILSGGDANPGNDIWTSPERETVLTDYE